MGRFRNVLILVYAAAGVAAWFVLRAMIADAEGFAIILGVVAAAALLVVLVLAYLFSLLLAGLLFRAGLPVWLVALLAVLLGPASAVGVVAVALALA